MDSITERKRRGRRPAPPYDPNVPKNLTAKQREAVTVAASISKRLTATQLSQRTGISRQLIDYWMAQPWWPVEVQRERERQRAERCAEEARAEARRAAADRADILARIAEQLDRPSAKLAKVIVTDSANEELDPLEFCECAGRDPLGHMFRRRRTRPQK